MADKKTVHVCVRTRFGVVFEGDVTAVSSVNDVGPFDILADHTNFVSMIKQRLTIHKVGGERQEMSLDNGVMIVEGNDVKVFLEVTKV